MWYNIQCATVRNVRRTLFIHSRRHTLIGHYASNTILQHIYVVARTTRNAARWPTHFGRCEVCWRTQVRHAAAFVRFGGFIIGPVSRWQRVCTRPNAESLCLCACTGVCVRVCGCVESDCTRWRREGGWWRCKRWICLRVFSRHSPLITRADGLSARENIIFCVPFAHTLAQSTALPRGQPDCGVKAKCGRIPTLYWGAYTYSLSCSRPWMLDTLYKKMHSCMCWRRIG